MKNLYLFFLFLAPFAIGQTHKHWLGVRGGMNFCYATARISDEFLVEQVRRLRGFHSYYAGFNYTYLRNNTLILSGDLIFLGKGGYVDYLQLPASGNQIDLTYSSDQISIPLHVGVNVGEKIYAQFLFGLNSTFVLNSKTYYHFQQKYYEEKPKYRSVFDLGMNAEARLGYCFKDQLRLFVSVNYDRSFLLQKFDLEIANTQTSNQLSFSVVHEYAAVCLGLSYNVFGDWQRLKPKKKTGNKKELNLKKIEEE